jgi:hypothetical protein
MARHRSFSSEFKRQISKEFLDGRAGLHEPILDKPANPWRINEAPSPVLPSCASAQLTPVPAATR